MVKLTKPFRRELSFTTDFRPTGRGRKVCMEITPDADGAIASIRFWPKGTQQGFELPLRTVFELAVKGAAQRSAIRKKIESIGWTVTRKARVTRFGLIGGK